MKKKLKEVSVYPSAKAPLRAVDQPSWNYSQALGFMHDAMPTILRIDGLRVVIYPDDYRPAHVHVIGAEGEAVFILNCLDGPPVLRETYGFSRRAVSRIEKELARHLSTLCPLWSDIHGDF